MAGRQHRRVVIGDVFEVATEAGLAYLQYTNDDVDMGPLVRVLPGTYANRPDDLLALVAGPTRFFILYHVRAAAGQSLVSWVCAAEVPNHAQLFPLMTWVKPRFDGTLRWATWDGQRKRTENLEVLTDEERDYPHRSMWNHAVLVEAVASDWSWRDETEREIADSIASQVEFAAARAQKPPRASLGDRLRRLIRG
jgi:hypothetical protein